MHRVIGERDLDETPFSQAAARDLLVEMVGARAFDERAVRLQRRGWMSSYPPFSGQEASQVGAAHAMREADILVPTYRSNAMQLARGVPPVDILLFRRGYGEFHSDHDVAVFPQVIPVGTGIPHATGAAMAASYRGTDEAVVCYFGDGATSQGDFHEGLNFAGVFDAPVLFFCENNGWAISTPVERQTASPTIAEKARAYGFEGGRVDGNDPLAVREFVASALERVRGGSPVLVESLTYRQGPHTTSDDPTRYVDDVDLPGWRTRDPIDRYAEYLVAQDVVDEGFREGVREDVEADLDDAVDAAERVAKPGPDDVFEHVFEELPPRLVEQRSWLRTFAQTDG